MILVAYTYSTIETYCKKSLFQRTLHLMLHRYMKLIFLNVQYCLYRQEQSQHYLNSFASQLNCFSLIFKIQQSCASFYSNSDFKIMLIFCSVIYPGSFSIVLFEPWTGITDSVEAHNFQFIISSGFTSCHVCLKDRTSLT